jgi:hypothetical protein
MTIDQAIHTMRLYNQCRRDLSDTHSAPDPITVGIAIDTVVDFAETTSKMITDIESVLTSCYKPDTSSYQYNPEKELMS